MGKNKISVTGITVKDWQTGNITGGNTDVKDKTPYVTFSAPAEQTFKMVCYGGYTISNLEYSVNFGDWKEVKDGEGVTFGGKNGGLRLRGKNVNGTAEDFSKYSTITFAYDEKNADNPNNVNVACTGDIRTLLNWKYYDTVDTQNARFCCLFYNCGVLTSAPDLPATKLANNCYLSMFLDCTSLTSAPELKATKLAENCYNSMFLGCTSLTSAPELKATTLAKYCYYGMFQGCTNLNTAPKLPAKTLTEGCYAYMFAYCTSLTSAPVLPATTLAGNCYEGMFWGCTKLSTVTMLAPSDKISKASNCCYNWLHNAGTDASVTSRTLKVMDADAYTALENTGYLPDNWKKGATNTTVLNKDNGKIE